VVGSHEMSGNFLTGFGNSAYDAQVRDIVHSLGTVTFTPAGEFIFDYSVLAPTTEANPNPQITGAALNEYTFKINQDLKFPDGTAITAADFVFAVYLAASPAMAKAGSTDSSFYQLKGYDAYNAGTSTRFEGIQFIDNYTFKMIINPDELPYFYKQAIVAVGPYQINQYLGLKGQGVAYTAGAWNPGTTTTGATVITEAQAKKIVDNLLQNPLGAGPYYISEVAEDLSFVTLLRNPNYPGDYLGITPEIDKIVIREVPGTTDSTHVLDGTIDYLEGVIEGTKIEPAIATNFVEYVTRLRNGYGLLVFHNDMPVVNDYRIRQAITYLIDRQAFVDQFLGGYGEVVHGPYGLSQWMVAESDVVPEKLIKYSLNKARAIELMEEAGYYYGDIDGKTLFDAAKHTQRYNKLGEPLVIYWGAQADSTYSDLLNPIIMAGFKDTGMTLKVDYLNWDAILSNYYYVVNELEEDPRPADTDE